MRLAFAIFAMLALSFGPVFAADKAPATLLADQLFINADTTLTAQGAVEVFYNDARLTASKLTYDRTTDRLAIEGPITLTDGTGTVILASAADLSSDLRDGILQSARLVLNDQLQLASVQLARIEGRYTQLDKVIASSCQVCPSNPVPLWEIRARRVIHDQQEHQLYFDSAQFRVAGLPIFYIPRLRMPDPTLKRATGFLLPSFQVSSVLGTGIKLPYFIAIGESRDVTLTPFLSDVGVASMQFRYRQAFGNGSIEFNGAISHDNILTGQARGYLFGTGNFALKNGYRAGFQLQTVSDDGYLLDYGISETDRLASGVYLLRTKRDSYFDARVFSYNSLRAADSNTVLPTTVGDLSYIRRMTPDLIGGQATLRFDLHSLNRRSSVNYDANGDGVTDGRDVTHASLGLDWRRQQVLTNGMILGAGLGITADLYAIGQDSSYPSTITRITPTASVDLRWPWVKSSGPGGASQIIEPIAQIIWSNESTTAVPNEDSLLVEFDEGNLFSFSRFPGVDLYESGLRANLGISYNRIDQGGWNVRVLAGRVIRAKDLGQFSTGSRLAGTSSDWLLASQVKSPDGLTLTNRALFDDKFEFSKDELQVTWDHPRYNLTANYVWLVADPAEGRPTATSEMAFNIGWQMSEGWRATSQARYDFLAERAAKAGVGFEYRNECAAVDLSLSRRFTSSTNVRPTTELSLSVQLSGFGTGLDGRSYRRSCGG
jgi:LPS-assembly protein